MSKNSIQVFIVDNHPLVMQGISSVIEDERDMEVCGEAKNAFELYSQLNKNIDLFIMDLFLEEGSGFDLMKFVRSNLPSSKILACTMYDKELVSRHVFRCGADGFLSKREISVKLIEAIRTLMNGDAYIDRQVVKKQLYNSLHADPSELRDKLETLSTREFEIFHMIGMGLNDYTITEILNMNMKKIRTHFETIQRKLGFRHKDDLFHQSSQWLQS